MGRSSPLRPAPGSRRKGLRNPSASPLRLPVMILMFTLDSLPCLTICALLALRPDLAVSSGLRVFGSSGLRVFGSSGLRALMAAASLALVACGGGSGSSTSATGKGNVPEPPAATTPLSLQAQVNQAKINVDSAEQRLSNAEQNNASASEIAQLKNELATLRERLARLEEQLSAIQQGGGSSVQAPVSRSSNEPPLQAPASRSSKGFPPFAGLEQVAKGSVTGVIRKVADTAKLQFVGLASTQSTKPAIHGVTLESYPQGSLSVIEEYLATRFPKNETYILESRSLLFKDWDYFTLGASVPSVDSGDKDSTLQTEIWTDYAGAGDSDYMVGGWWLLRSADLAGDYRFGAFTHGSNLYPRSGTGPVKAAVTGEATYKGPAAGLHTSSENGMVSIQRLLGKVTLDADFGTTAARGTIKGKIDNLTLDGNSVNGQLLLPSATFHNVNWHIRPVLTRNLGNINGINYNGDWAGTFQGDSSGNDQPTGIVGVVGGSGGGNSFVASFGAKRVEDED